ncbi:hypothetical protein M2283_009393 [Streptomyces pseudovenezuelae]|uniref:NADP-dependent oxidoreductase domain-containing protein n=1 Tax=Streptomyces pseudovenezuelae TaxID=67350 RepID=A0ABT6M0G2_9ACTN|nr:hypothetical protein [Streptomyces pseudovenezuelae]
MVAKGCGEPRKRPTPFGHRPLTPSPRSHTRPPATVRTLPSARTPPAPRTRNETAPPATAGRFALAWVLAQDGVTAVPGTKRRTWLERNVAAEAIDLDPATARAVGADPARAMRLPTETEATGHSCTLTQAELGVGRPHFPEPSVVGRRTAGARLHPYADRQPAGTRSAVVRRLGHRSQWLRSPQRMSFVDEFECHPRVCGAVNVGEFRCHSGMRMPGLCAPDLLQPWEPASEIKIRGEWVGRVWVALCRCGARTLGAGSVRVSAS